jgi:hypothetical protein
MLSAGVTVDILSRTPVFYFAIPPSVSSIVIVVMYHLVPTPESFEIEHVNSIHTSMFFSKRYYSFRRCR